MGERKQTRQTLELNRLTNGSRYVGDSLMPQTGTPFNLITHEIYPVNI